MIVDTRQDVDGGVVKHHLVFVKKTAAVWGRKDSFLAVIQAAEPAAMNGELRLRAESKSGDESPHSKNGADSNCFTPSEMRRIAGGRVARNVQTRVSSIRF